MKQSFMIPGQMPSLNEYISAERRNRHIAAKMKREWNLYIVAAIKKARLKKMRVPVTIEYIHYAPNKRRDRDNIAGIVHKFTQDALVCAGIIENDTWDMVTGFTDQWEIDRKNPRTEVTITEV